MPPRAVCCDGRGKGYQAVALPVSQARGLSVESGIPCRVCRVETPFAQVAGADGYNLLRHLAIIRSNQLRAIEIAYLSMREEFTYLISVMDWRSREVLS